MKTKNTLTYVVLGTLVLALVGGFLVLSSTFTMHGQMNASCYSFRTVVSVGDEVTVYDEHGDIIGHGNLQTPYGGGGSDCYYPFEVDHLPNFKSVYSVGIGEIVNRVSFDRQGAENPVLVNK
jgi:hypothetical protein